MKQIGTTLENASRFRMRRLLSLLSLSALLTGVLAMAGPTPASAGATIQVATFLDGDQPQCSLRSAIRATNSNSNVTFCGHDGSAGKDTIVLKAGTYRLTDGGDDDTANLGDLDITGDLLIRGAGARRTIIDASDLSPRDRVFHIVSGEVTLKGLTVTGGKSPLSVNGGGILNNGSLTLNRVLVRGNSSGGNGGGLFHLSGSTDLDIRNSTFSSNTAKLHGGGIGINQTGSEVTNVTVSGNRAGRGGGGVFIGAFEVDLLSMTIADNRADANNDGIGNGGGLLVLGSSNMSMENSLLGKNTDSSTGMKAPDCRFETVFLTTNHDNLIAKTRNCGFPAGTGNILNKASGLGSLRNNGGPTSTHALIASSPAVRAGSGCPPADQRGAPRNGCDIGAYQRVMCKSVVVNRVGTEGGEKLRGTARRDGILALGGKDVVFARGGKDSVCAGADNDVVRGQGDDDKVVGNGGNDRIFGGAGGDALKGNAGDDLLDGGGATDRCRGGPGDDNIRDCEA